MQIFPRREGPFAAFVAPARRRNELWRLALACVLILTAFVVAGFAVSALGYAALGADFMRDIAVSGSFGSSPMSILILLGSFPVVLLGLWAMLRLLYRRRLGSLFGAGPAGIVRNAAIAAVVVALITGLGTAISFLAAPPAQNLALATWLGWMMLVLPLLLVQVTTEELIFRGFLQQQLAARFDSPWMWMVLPSVIFGALHYQPGVLGDNAWIAVALTALIGIIAADLTARTGNIGAAVGLHFTNNFFALCLVSLDGGMSGVSLFVTRYTARDSDLLQPLLLLDAATITVIYGIYLFIVNRRGRH